MLANHLLARILVANMNGKNELFALSLTIMTVRFNGSVPILMTEQMVE